MLLRLWLNRHKCKKINKRGFIFVDILIGVVIVSVALVALATAYRQATMAMVDIRNRTEALAIAQQKMEYLKRYDGGLISPPTSSPNEYQQTTITGASGVQFVVTPNLHAKSGAISSLDAKLIPVEVAVSWNQPQGDGALGQRTLRLVQYLQLR